MSGLERLKEWMRQSREKDGFLWCCETAVENGLDYATLDALLAVVEAAEQLDEHMRLNGGCHVGCPEHDNLVKALAAFAAAGEIPRG